MHVTECRLASIGWPAGIPAMHRSVGDGVSELRIDCGPGYRVYFMRRGVDAVVLLCGGDKNTQLRDIERAMTIAQDWRG